MIDIKELESLAKAKEEDNYKFRRFLKARADSKELDEQFKELHDKYFAIYDCSKCKNCCVSYNGTIPKKDVEKDAKYLGITVEEFVDKYLDTPPIYEGYTTKNKPCDFFVDNKCILGECKPEACKAYPHTNMPYRLESFYSVIDKTFVCPVVYEIVEELKYRYGFR